MNELSSFQIAFFLRNLDLSDKLSIAEKTKKKFPDLLNGSPTILPIPDDAPLEIPRIIFPSIDKSNVVNIAKSRIDFIRNNKLKSNSENLKSEFLEIVNGLSDLVINELNANPFRLGVILNYQMKVKTSAIEHIKQNHKLLRSNPLQVEIHQQYQGDIEEMKTNQWVRIIARDFEMNNSGKDDITISVDVNTVMEQAYKIPVKKAINFFTQAIEISEKEIESLKK